MTRTTTPTKPLRGEDRDGDVTLSEALLRVDNPRLASSLSVFYAELARAQAHGDQEAIDYARSAIAEAMRGVPEGPIDVPLEPLPRKRRKKSRR